MGEKKGGKDEHQKRETGKNEKKIQLINWSTWHCKQSRPHATSAASSVRGSTSRNHPRCPTPQTTTLRHTNHPAARTTCSQGKHTGLWNIVNTHRALHTRPLSPNQHPTADHNGPIDETNSKTKKKHEEEYAKQGLNVLVESSKNG